MKRLISTTINGREHEVGRHLQEQGRVALAAELATRIQT